MNAIGFRVVNCSCSSQEDGVMDKVIDVGEMGTAIRIGTDAVLVFWDNGTIANYHCDGSLNCIDAPIATNIHISIGCDDHPHPVVDDHYRDNTQPQQSNELVDEFTIQLGHSSQKVCSSEEELADGLIDDTAAIECKPGISHCGAEEKKCHQQSSEFLTVLPACTSYYGLLMELRRHHSSKINNNVIATVEKQSDHLVHYDPITSHDHNYV